MTDQLPNVEGDNGRFHEAQAVVVFGADGQPVTSGAGGAISAGNSSQDLLLAGEVFTGVWEASSFEQVLVKALSDAPATAQIQFGIVKDGVDPTGALTDTDIIADPIPVDTVYANSQYFRTLVKGSGRAFRIVYTNGPTDQTSFFLFTTYGEAVFPPSTSADNEILITQKESERSHFVAVNADDVSTTAYKILIDLDDTTGYPHSFTGRVDLSAVYINVDRASSAVGLVQLGVITRIDATNADISYIQGVSFKKGSETIISRDRIYAPNRLKCGVTSGELNNVATGFVVVNDAAVNTGVTFANALGGTSTPAVGDVIAKFTHTGGGAFDATFSGFYLTERAA